MGLISVIVPIYNVEKYLDRCIKSIINQTYRNLEIILVDDGSPDSCPMICDEWAKSDDRIIVIHKENGGLSDARNVGILKSRGEYILFVDSDDYIEATACEKLMQGMLSNDVSFVVGAIKEVHQDKIILQKHTGITNNKEYSAKEFIEKSVKNGEWYAPAVMNLYRKSHIIDNQLFFKVGRYFEDMEILPRMYLCAQNIVYIDFPFYNYMVRENSIMTSLNNPQKIKDAFSVYEEWLLLFSDIENNKFKKQLYGFLVKCYLKSCRNHKVSEWIIKGVDFKFAMTNALNFKEILKIFYFSLFPKLYIKEK